MVELKSINSSKINLLVFRGEMITLVENFYHKLYFNTLEF